MRRSHLVALAVAVLAAAVGVAVVIRSTPACAAALLLAAERTGQATYYGPAAPGGACSFPTPPADHLTAAAGPADYAEAAACGGYLQVTGQADGYQVAGARRFATLNIGGSTATAVCTVVEAE